MDSTSSSGGGPALPWRDRERLIALAAALTDALHGRAVHDLVSGPGWAILQLSGEARPAVVLTALPGATTVFAHSGPLPPPLRRALPRGGAVPPPLRGDVVTGVTVPGDDLVIALRLAGPGGKRHLLHQLFGSPGNTALLDGSGRLLWAHRALPHPCLLTPPSAAAYDTTTSPPDGTIATFTAAGLDRLTRQRETAIAEQLRRALARRETTAERLVANLAADLAGADRGDDLRRDAETLAVHLHAVPPGQHAVDLADPRDGSRRRITLDPAAPPAATLERLFKAARRAERGREVIANRLADARSTLAAVHHELDALAGLPECAAGLDRLVAILDLRDRVLGAPPATSGEAARRAEEAAPRPFRRYRLLGRWEVWVGRDREENDVLTHRASHPRDLWLHAQGVTGSHVILRTDGRPDQVPRQVIELAAAIAALHSRARHSALVPVIWTERRYVRKPRKAPPGTAVCLQERSLFVAPGVPPAAELI